MHSRGKHRVFEIVERSQQGDPASRLFDICLLTLVSLNLLAIALETVAPIAERARSAFLVFEVVSVAIFTVEYFTRMWACTADPAYSHPIRGRLRFAIKPLVLMDLIAIAPFYIPFFVTLDLRFVRFLRMLRVFRLVKIARYLESVAIVGSVLRSRRDMLISTLFVALLLLFASSALMYFVENEAQPDSFSSIPAAMWWGIATLTTVGYGDLAPTTALGQILGAVAALLGIGLFALPAGILGSAFVDEIQTRRKSQRVPTCPTCGEPCSNCESVAN